jgi:hypothetical protein
MFEDVFREGNAGVYASRFECRAEPPGVNVSLTILRQEWRSEVQSGVSDVPGPRNLTGRPDAASGGLGRV